MMTLKWKGKFLSHSADARVTQSGWPTLPPNLWLKKEIKQELDVTKGEFQMKRSPRFSYGRWSDCGGNLSSFLRTFSVLHSLTAWPVVASARYAALVPALIRMRAPLGITATISCRRTPRPMRLVETSLNLLCSWSLRPLASITLAELCSDPRPYSLVANFTESLQALRNGVVLEDLRPGGKRSRVAHFDTSDVGTFIVR